MSDHRPPEYAHQLAALLARMAQEDRDFVGQTIRVRSKQAPPAPRSRSHGGGRRSRAPRTATPRYERALLPSGFDLTRASPLSGAPRQTGPRRLPYFDMKRVTKVVVPRSRDGGTHPRYPDRRKAARHVTYVGRGAHVSHASHLDYLVRSDALGVVDIIDAEEDRCRANETAIFTNIEGGPDGARSLFEAAEDLERTPRLSFLTTSSDHAEDWAKLAAAPSAPAWIVEANLQLQTELRQIEGRRKKQDANKPHKPVAITIATVTLEQAYECLTDWDQQGHSPKMLQFKQGRTGRVQTRFVAELPAGSTPSERRRILEAFCKPYVDLGCPVFGAIHRPDPHNAHSNWHMHVDVYDRPAKWLATEGCWDFEYREKDRYGRWHFPHRQNKIAALTRSEEGSNNRSHGREWMKAERARLVHILNAERPPGSPTYVTGTYADNAIQRTPTLKLGTRAMAKEEAGVVTPNGSQNAHIIFADLLKTIQGRRDQEERSATKAMARMAAMALKNVEPSAYTKSIKAIGERLIALLDRRCEQQQFEVVLAMARSRAETVLRTLDVKSGLTRITRSKAPQRGAMRAAAEERLAEIATIVPPERVRVRRRQKLDALIQAQRDDLARLDTQFKAALGVQYHLVSDGGEQVVGPLPASTDLQRKLEDRLIAYIIRHQTDARRLIFTDDRLALGEQTPKSVRTLFAKLHTRPAIQSALAAAHRAQLEAPLSARQQIVAGRQSTAVTAGAPDRSRLPQHAPAAEAPPAKAAGTGANVHRTSAPPPPAVPPHKLTIAPPAAPRRPEHSFEPVPTSAPLIGGAALERSANAAQASAETPATPPAASNQAHVAPSMQPVSNGVDAHQSPTAERLRDAQHGAPAATPEAQPRSVAGTTPRAGEAQLGGPAIRPEPEDMSRAKEIEQTFDVGHVRSLPAMPEGRVPADQASSGVPKSISPVPPGKGDRQPPEASGPALPSRAPPPPPPKEDRLPRGRAAEQHPAKAEPAPRSRSGSRRLRDLAAGLDKPDAPAMPKGGEDFSDPWRPKDRDRGR